MRSYLEIINELMETVATDDIPEVDKEKINDLIQQLADMIWKYSD